MNLFVIEGFNLETIKVDVPFVEMQMSVCPCTKPVPGLVNKIPLYVPHGVYEEIKNSMDVNSTWGIKGFISVQASTPRLVVENITYIGEMQNGK